jgi:20S proteasome alpha/beta subunit
MTMMVMMPWLLLLLGMLLMSASSGPWSSGILIRSLSLVSFLPLVQSADGGSNTNNNLNPSLASQLAQQVEFARRHASRGSPIMAMKFRDGIGIAVASRRRNNSFIIERSDLVNKIDNHVVLLASGLEGDCKLVVNLAKLICRQYRDNFGAPITLDYLCGDLARSIHGSTLKGVERPLAANIILCGWDGSFGFQIYSLEADGSYHSWNEVALGQASEPLTADVETELERVSGRDELNISTGIPIMLNAVRRRLSPFALRRFCGKQQEIGTSGDTYDDDEWTPQILVCTGKRPRNGSKTVLWRGLRL